MADQYGLFFNSINGDRVYDADSFSEWLNKFFTTGVFNGELQVTADSGMAVNVASGYANINGKVRFFEQSQTFTLDPASGVYPRIDTIVVRLDTTNRMITTEYVKGDYSGNNPQPTEPTRTGGLYEIVLAQIYVSAGATQILTNDITDTRSDDSVCGWVTSTVEGVPMDQIVAQMTADFMTWFDHMKDQLDTDAAGHLQQEIDTINEAVSSIETTVSNHSKSLGIIEDGETASQLHHKGQYFVRNGRFVYAMIEIAEGDTLTLGTNYMYTDVGSQLQSLNNGLTHYDLSGWTTLTNGIEYASEGAHVFIRFNIGVSLTTSFTTLATLPVGKRPSYNEYFRVAGSNGSGNVTVLVASNTGYIQAKVDSGTGSAVNGFICIA